MVAKLKTKTISSPLGPISLFVDDVALVAAFLDGQKIPTLETRKMRGAHPLLDSAARDFEAYFSGSRAPVATPLALAGTAFQMKVWRALQTIPFGETWSYQKQAKQIGNVRAVRAVGLANSKNPISILVPCHRVIAANGALSGYAGGIEKKRWLLDHEASQLRFMS